LYNAFGVTDLELIVSQGAPVAGFGRPWALELNAFGVIGIAYSRSFLDFANRGFDI
jgi:hypothetical protein